MADGSGWIRVGRRLFTTSHDLHPRSTGEPACRAFAWTEMIGLANWRDDAPTEGLKRGQLSATVRELARRWNWKHRRSERFLNALQREDRIHVDPAANQYDTTVITILHYDEWQARVGSTAASAPDPAPSTEPGQQPGQQPGQHSGQQDPHNAGPGDGTPGQQMGQQPGQQPGQHEQPKARARVEEEKKKEVTDTGDGGLPAPGDLPKDGGRYRYPESFEALWVAYPARQGGNPKKGAYRKWRARVRDGVDPDVLRTAVEHYRAHCEEEEKVGTRYVMQARTFFGPDEHWREDWEPDGLSDADRQMIRRRAEIEEVDLRREVGP